MDAGATPRYDMTEAALNEYEHIPTDEGAEELLINMGPQHPSTRGVLRLVLTLDGERVQKCVPHIGYLHSSMEKIAERKTYKQYVPYADRFDYLNAMGNELCYVTAVEELLGIEVPPRGQFIRVIMAEMQRIASHLIYMAAIGIDTGATTVFLYGLRERELLLNLFELASGQRLLYHYLRIGGARNDLPGGFVEGLAKFLDLFPSRMKEYDAILTGNRIFRSRLEGVGAISLEDARSYACTGPVLRACGVPYDVRKVAPYSVYDQFEFDVPTQDKGDCMSRHLVRMAEMRQSVRILRQALEKLPEGEVNAKVPRIIKPPPGEAYARVESPRGELACWLISDGGDKPYRMHWRAPSFYNLQAIEHIARGIWVADMVPVIATLDIILGDIDR